MTDPIADSPAEPQRPSALGAPSSDDPAGTFAAEEAGTEEAGTEEAGTEAAGTDKDRLDALERLYRSLEEELDADAEGTGAPAP